MLPFPRPAALVDLILVLVIVEGTALWLYGRRYGRGPGPAQIAANLLAGMCLLLALRAALSGLSMTWILAALTGALVAHVADVGLRWRR